MDKRSTNKITLDLSTPQKGKIKVHTKIINDLSSGIYSSPASCIKELINNSYDAEAHIVTIRIKPIQDNIDIIDDGIGMNALDFDKNFTWISKSTKRDEGEYSPKLKRPLIGKIGIGFIAVNEICDELEITSSKLGEAFKFTAKINFKDYFNQSILEETLDIDESQKGIIKAEYDLINEEEDKDQHYTIIRLNGLKEGVKKILDDQLYYNQLVRSSNKDYNKNYFLSMYDLLENHKKQDLRSFSEDNEYVKFIIDLASYIPVEYLDKGPIEWANDKIIDKIVNYHKKLSFKVDLDGIYLKKPIFFTKALKDTSSFLSFDESITMEDGVLLKFKGYFYSQNKILYPREINGISLKIKGIPIAERYGFDTTFMQYPSYINQLFMNWISGEIYIDSGLENAMNIDRSSFRLTHPHYIALQEYVHKLLTSSILPMTMKLYNTGKAKREVVKVNIKEKKINNILKSKKYSIEEIDPKLTLTKKRKRINTNSPIQIVEKNSDNVIVKIDKSFRKSFSKKDWEYLEDIFLIFEMAYSSCKNDAGKLKTLFYQKIAEWQKK